MRVALVAAALFAAGITCASAGGKVGESQVDLRSVDMVDSKIGWALGVRDRQAMLLSTGDGGRTWADISPSPLRSLKITVANDADEQIFFHLQDARHGWAAIDSGGEQPNGPPQTESLFQTEDGGHHWKKSAFQSAIGQITTVQFVDPEHGFILVESDPASGHSRKAVYRTVDGGKTWRIISGSLPGTGLGAIMVFRNPADGWITASPRGDETQFFFRTRDGGRTWDAEPLEPPPGFVNWYAAMELPVFFGARKLEGMFTVRYIQPDPEQNVFGVYITRDGGRHWSRANGSLTGLPESPDTSPSFIDLQRGWAMSDGKLFTTADGGAKWREVSTNLYFGEKESVAQFLFVDAATGWLMKNIFDGNNHYELLGTTDGGRTWTHRFGSQGELPSPSKPESAPIP